MVARLYISYGGKAGWDKKAAGPKSKWAMAEWSAIDKVRYNAKHSMSVSIRQ